MKIAFANFRMLNKGQTSFNEFAIFDVVDYITAHSSTRDLNTLNFLKTSFLECLWNSKKSNWESIHCVLTEMNANPLPVLEFVSSNKNAEIEKSNIF